MSWRVWVAAAVAGAIALVAVFLLQPPSGAPDDAPSQGEMAESIGAPVMELLHRGHVPGRSAEIMLVPKPDNYLYGQPDLTVLGTRDFQPGSSHPNPWRYLVHVPIVFWAPGLIDSGVSVDRPVDISSIAPTYAEMLGAEPLEGAGDPLDEVLSATGGKRNPKVIFNVVIDGGGWNALEEHPRAWPTIGTLRDEGTVYMNANIGSAPSITGALHATFGTGHYPIEHGFPGNQMRDPEGVGREGDPTIDTWLENADPRYMEEPAQAELWDEQNGNRPIVATVSYEGWHLGMIGHGAQRKGGDKDIAVLWEKDEFEWFINEDYYTLPPYLRETDLATLERYERQLDERDGEDDGLWLGNDLESIQDATDPEDPDHATLASVRPGTPAFARFTGDAVVDVIRKEDWGRDAITDMFWVEMKMPDYAGHIWNVISPEEEDVLAEVDTQIARFRKELDRKVGRGNYIIMISADHGQQPVPEVTGGWRINSAELGADIKERFGEDVVTKVTPVDVYVDLEVVAEEDVDIDEIASFLGTYTIGDNVPAEQPGADRVPEARLEETVFAGVFSTDYLSSLTPERIESFGEGEYPDGRLDEEDEG